jgi:GntR family transcriptional regulator, transcriptional repressor for pyruvate dehydrogenase complex
MTDLTPFSGKSLVRTAIDAVRDHIRTQQLRVGDTLPGESFFAEQLGVSRAVMREAFGALAALKQLDVGNGRRARVGALDGSVLADSLEHAISTAQIGMLDVWDVRRTIEMRTASLAATNASSDQIARIIALSQAMARDDQPHDETTDDDIAFHLAIAEASGNALFFKIVASFVPLMRVAVPMAWQTRKTSAERQDILDRHRQLALAIARRSPDEAQAWMASHFDEAIGASLRGTETSQ